MSMTQQEITVLLHCAKDGIGQDKDTMMNSYEDITCIETEISGYRRGCIRVRIDFDKRMVTWRDSLQWNNNFLRSISPDKIQHFRTALPSTHILQWKTITYGPNPQETALCCHPEDWAVTVSFRQNPPARISGSGKLPAEWARLRELIEYITKIPFRLR